jgi:hypothetical protein
MHVMLWSVALSLSKGVANESALRQAQGYGLFSQIFAPKAIV